MNKILIVYIATGPYKAQYGGFRSSLKLLCPEDEKEVVIMTDYPSYFQSKFYGEYLPSTILMIPHQPWPIPTLLKFHYIRDVMERVDSTHVCYFNANSRFNRRIIHEQFFNGDKLTVTEHWGWTTYGGKKVSGILGDKKVTEGNAVIPTEDYTYVNAGVVGGSRKAMKEACEWIINACNDDLKKCIIPTFHDESYLNAYCYKFKDKINILPSRFTYDSNRLRDIVELGDEIPYITYAESQFTQDSKNY